MNIILQHWTGELGALEILSSADVSWYAKSIHADYELLRGDVFRPRMSSQCQKIFMLDESFDDYDNVVMVDADMFIRKGMTENIFEHDGIGLNELMQWGLCKKLRYMYPDLGNRKYSYWGGAVYKLDRAMRKRLRKHIREDEIVRFKDEFCDEGIMHRLEIVAKVKGHYFNTSKWSKSSYEPDVDEAYFIHIRPRKLIDGKKVMFSKMINYHDLVDRGLIQ